MSIVASMRQRLSVPRPNACVPTRSLMFREREMEGKREGKRHRDRDRDRDRQTEGEMETPSKAD